MRAHFWFKFGNTEFLEASGAAASPKTQDVYSLLQERQS
jgi:hypothetical protein